MEGEEKDKKVRELVRCKKALEELEEPQRTLEKIESAGRDRRRELREGQGYIK